MNTSFRLCPDADILYAMDAVWWQHHMPEVKRTFTGERWSIVRVADVALVRFQLHCLNGGAGAIALAAKLGALRVFLLGYDAQKTGGRAHWHGDHPRGMGNAGKSALWPAQFAELRSWLDHRVDVINLSRETAITCFRRGTVEEYLNPGVKR